MSELREPTWQEDLRALASPWAILLLTLFALLLRLYHLGAQSLWVDELITIFQGNVPGYSLWTQFRDDAQNPLPMVIFTWMGWIRGGEAWLRLPSAVFGALSVPLLYRVASRLVGTRAALFAALLLTVHPLHVLHSQEIRGYAALLFFGLLTIEFILGCPRNHRPGFGRMLAITGAGSATILCNLSGLFWMAGIGMGALWSGRINQRSWLRWGLVFAAMLAITSHWWALSAHVHESERLLPGAETGEALRGESTFNVWSLPYAGLALAFGSQLGPTVAELHAIAEGADLMTTMRPHLGWIVCAAGLALILCLAGFPALRSRRQEWWLWALAPLLLAILLALRNVKPFNPRYVLAALPSLLLLWGVALDRLPRRTALFLLAACLALDGVALARQWFDPGYARADVRAAVREIARREGRDDMILAPTVNRVVSYYHHGPAPVHTLFPGQLASDEGVRAGIDGLPEGPRYLWFVRARAWVSDPQGRVSRHLEERYRTIGHFELPGVRVVLFDRSSPPAVESGVD